MCKFIESFSYPIPPLTPPPSFLPLTPPPSFLPLTPILCIFSILRNLQNFKDSLLYKLRWVTLGYHYNWTTKLYSHSNQSPFPEDLSCLSEYLLSTIGFKQFKAEAAIVNYYHLDSTLSGHTDHSEKDLEAPLISIRFEMIFTIINVHAITVESCYSRRPAATVLNLVKSSGTHELIDLSSKLKT